jgi:hypothetical protein
VALLGYHSVYLKRPSLTISERSGLHKRDGCGIFFASDRFDIILEHQVCSITRSITLPFLVPLFVTFRGIIPGTFVNFV